MADQQRVDILSRNDIEALLRRFYGRVLVDDLLASPFTEVREVTGLDAHIPVMCDFWETVLFRAGLYKGSALTAHRHVHHRTALSARHFIRWLATWNNTVDEMYCGPVAGQAKVQAARIAWAMHRRLTGGDVPELDALLKRDISGGRCVPRRAVAAPCADSATRMPGAPSESGATQ